MIFHRRKNPFSAARHDFVQKFVTKKLIGENNHFYSVTMVNKSKSFRWDGHVSGVAIQRAKKICFVKYSCFCTIIKLVPKGL
jgi:hypothetical protein